MSDDITPHEDPKFRSPTPGYGDPNRIIVWEAQPGITEGRTGCRRLLWRWSGGANGQLRSA